MEQKLSVIIPREGKTIDIDTNDVEVALTKQSLDVLRLETRFNPVSSIIEIPNSKKNQYLFEHLNDVRERLTNVANKELEATLENGGVRIVDRGRLKIIKANNQRFEALLTDDADFVTAILEPIEFSDLWPELYGSLGQTFFSFPAINPEGRWYDEAIDARLNLGADAFGFAWGVGRTLSDSVNTLVNVNTRTYPFALCAPFLFVKTFFDRLATSAGLTFSSPLLADNNFLNAVVPLESLDVTERMSEYSANSFNITSPKNQNGTILFPWQNVNILYAKNGSSTIDTGSGTIGFTGTTSQIEIVASTLISSGKQYGKGTYNIRVKGTGNFNSAIMFIAARNGVLSTSGDYDVILFADVVSTQFDVEVSHEFPLFNGATYKLDDYIDFVVILVNMTGGANNGVSNFELDVRLAEGQMNPYNPVDWTGLLPFERPIDMFKAVQKQFGFTVSWEKYTKTCFLRPFSEIWNTAGREDFTEFVDWSQADISIGWDSLARNNYLRFSGEDSGGANIQVSGDALAAEETILEFDFEKTNGLPISVFNLTDIAQLIYHTGDFDFPNIYDLGFEAGTGSVGTKICLLTEGALDVSVEFIRLMPLTNPTANWSTFVNKSYQSYKVLRTLNLNNENYILANYYGGLERFYTHPRRVSVPIHLPPEIFRRYDTMRLIFINQANSWFFIERISNYLPNKAARAELILVD
jgi:hypothetical protein